MSRHLHLLTATVSSDTVYSSAMRLQNGVRLMAVVKIGDGDGTVDVMLQAGWSGSSEDANDWVDTAMSVSGLAAGDFGQIVPTDSDGTIFAAFPHYRLKATGANNTDPVTVTVQVTEAD